MKLIMYFHTCCEALESIQRQTSRCWAKKSMFSNQSP
jgi:hypothetical protein